ncbi:MAG: hypothetical protein QOE63_1539, partial [Acidimicrobiaceae bacterium]
MAATIDDLTAHLAPPLAPPRPAGPWLLLAPVAVAAAVLGVVAADRVEIVAADWVRLALVIAWTAAGVSALRQAALHHAARLVLGGAVLGAVSFATARYAATSTGTASDVAGLVAPLACLGVIAMSAHFLLALPDGHLRTRARLVGAIGAYAGALVVGLLVWSSQGELSVGVGAWAWTITILLCLPAAHRRYLASAGLVRQRLQWLGCGATLAGEVGLAMGALRVLVGWPEHAGAIAAVGTGLLPLAIA